MSSPEGIVGPPIKSKRLRQVFFSGARLCPILCSSGVKNRLR
jgi:hypothetical protein